MIGIIAAIVLATLGTIALISYVQNAKDDAIADEAVVTVLVLTDTVAEGASAGAIVDAIEATSIPVRLKVPDALTDVAQIAGRVTMVELRPGEQLLDSRLIEPEQLVSVEVPSGLQEVTISLDPQRAVGASLEPGDTVGMVLSFDSLNPSAADATVTVDGADDAASMAMTPKMTHLTLNQVLVTGVQLSQVDRDRVVDVGTGTIQPDDAVTDDSEAATEDSPRQEVLITLAVTAPEAEQIVFAAEFGLIWLTSQNTTTDLDGSRIVTHAQVLAVVPRS
jgi:pilus assembly protein CpaB